MVAVEAEEVMIMEVPVAEEVKQKAVDVLFVITMRRNDMFKGLLETVWYTHRICTAAAQERVDLAAQITSDLNQNQ